MYGELITEIYHKNQEQIAMILDMLREVLVGLIFHVKSGKSDLEICFGNLFVQVLDSRVTPPLCHGLRNG